MAIVTHVRIGDTPLKLVRTVRFGADGARGILYLPDGNSIHTLEDFPIPPGAYFLNPDRTGKHRNWIVESVLGSRAATPYRVDVEIHAGNTLVDSAGCILPGFATNRQGVINSKNALEYLIDLLERDVEEPKIWVLNITQAF